MTADHICWHPVGEKGMKNSVEFMLKSKYDALAEKLRETELRLRMYGGHTANCAYHLSHYKGPVSQCDCMWTDLVPTVFAAQREVAK